MLGSNRIRRMEASELAGRARAGELSPVEGGTIA